MGLYRREIQIMQTRTLTSEVNEFTQRRHLRQELINRTSLAKLKQDLFINNLRVEHSITGFDLFELGKLCKTHCIQLSRAQLFNNFTQIAMSNFLSFIEQEHFIRQALN